MENNEELELNRGDERDDDIVTIQYDITSYPSDYTLRGLYHMFKNGDITIPDYQRGYVWSIKQASLLIESFLIGLPVPPIFLYVDDENKNLVIDGQQRLLSVVFFMDGFFGEETPSGKKQIFKLSGLKPDNKYYNKRFTELPDKDKRKLESSVLRAINIRQLSPKGETTCVYHIFERLNTGGTPLKPQEIRNCVFRSVFLKRLSELNKNKNWRNIINKQNPVKNQTDVELILRIYGLTYYLDEYEKPMKEFLNKISEKNMKFSSNIDNFCDSFIKTAEYIDRNLRQKPFNVRGPFNTSLFDSVFCNILKNIDRLPQNLPQLFEELILDSTFIDYTTSATTDEKILTERFKYVEKYLFKDDIQAEV